MNVELVYRMAKIADRVVGTKSAQVRRKWGREGRLIDGGCGIEVNMNNGRQRLSTEYLARYGVPIEDSGPRQGGHHGDVLFHQRLVKYGTLFDGLGGGGSYGGGV